MRKVPYGFEPTAYEPIDARIILTKAQMKDIIGDEAAGSDFAMPEVYFALCIDDGQWYRFDYGFDEEGNPTRTPDPETGYFTKMELGGSTPAPGSGTTADMAAALGDANPGDEFYNTDNKILYVCEEDSEGTKAWVEKQPAIGEMMYDQTSGKILYYDGEQWKEVGGTDVVPTTEPLSPQVGDHWLDTTVTPPVEKVWDGTQWVEVPPTVGEMLYDESTGKILYYDGNTWREVGGTPEVTSGTTAPSPAHAGDRWLDTNQTPPVLKEYDGTTWKPVTATTGDMMYDAANDKILYFDGTEWKEIAGGVEHQSSVGPSTPGEDGEIVYDEQAKEFKTLVEAGSGDSGDVWVTLAKVWEGTTAQYEALNVGGGDAWSRNHPDVICFITD